MQIATAHQLKQTHHQISISFSPRITRESKPSKALFSAHEFQLCRTCSLHNLITRSSRVCVRISAEFGPPLFHVTSNNGAKRQPDSPLIQLVYSDCRSGLVIRDSERTSREVKESWVLRVCTYAFLYLLWLSGTWQNMISEIIIYNISKTHVKFILDQQSRSTPFCLVKFNIGFFFQCYIIVT